MTGATGFVGGHVLNLAVKQGYHLRALTRKVQDARPHVTWVEGALDNPESLKNLCEGAEAVIHIAGVVNAPTRAEFELGNVTGTLNLIEAAKQAGVFRFIHVSSLAAKRPDLSIYGDTKAKAEKIVTASGLDWTIIRPPWIFGPGDSDTLDMFKAARLGFVPLPIHLGGKVSVIDVRDLSELLLAIVPAHDDLTAQIFEVADGKPDDWTYESFARAIGQAMGRKVRPVAIPKAVMRFGAATDRLLRGKKAKLTHDRVSYFAHDDWTSDAASPLPVSIWKPANATPAALRDTVQWYRQNDWL